jgi:hypothetical protein
MFREELWCKRCDQRFVNLDPESDGYCPRCEAEWQEDIDDWRELFG